MKLRGAKVRDYRRLRRPSLPGLPVEACPHSRSLAARVPGKRLPGFPVPGCPGSR